MENSFQTSFIPKKPITSTISNKTPKSLFSIISIFLLVVSVALSGGLFFYKSYLTKQKEIASEALLKVRDDFEKDTIDELDLFNRRTEVAKQILNNHIVFSPLFTLLGEITIPSIQYTKFDQKTVDSGFVVSMEGVARDYRSIALQADVFNSAKAHYFKNVVFSNLTKDDKTNKINFNLEFTVDSSLLSYEKSNLAAPIATPPAPAPTITPTPTPNPAPLPPSSPLPNDSNVTQ